MLKIKVCGMREDQNISDLCKLPIDFIGFIFYSRSPRYINELDTQLLDKNIPETIKRVGVFVNEVFENLSSCVDKYKLDFVQLHGDEDSLYCQKLKDKHPEIKIIKAINVLQISDFEQTEKYKDVCDYYLFDTKTERRGGSGKKFDWSILNAYTGNLPFFLSGGISAQDVNDIKSIAHPRLYALDLNSKFETEPGLKEIELLKQFVKSIKL